MKYCCLGKLEVLLKNTPTGLLQFLQIMPFAVLVVCLIDSRSSAVELTLTEASVSAFSRRSSIARIIIPKWLFALE